MASTMPERHRSTPVRLPDDFGPRQAKASLKSPTVRTEARAFECGAALWDVLVAGHGSVKATAFTMDNTDPSLLRRQVLDGTLPIKKLFEADPKALLALGEFLVEKFGDAQKSRSDLAREKILALVAAILETVGDTKDTLK